MTMPYVQSFSVVIICVLLSIARTNASDCSRCENFVQSTRTLMGMVSKEEDVGLGTFPEVYESTFAPMMREAFGSDTFDTMKLSALAEENGEHSRKKVVNVILEVMRYCQANPVECGMFRLSISLSLSLSLSHTHTHTYPNRVELFQ